MADKMSDPPPPYPGDTRGDGYAPLPEPAYYQGQAYPQNTQQQPPPSAYYPQQQPYMAQPYPPMPATSQSTIVVAQPVHTTFVSTFGDSPTAATCTNCGQSIITKVEAEPNGMAWFWCILMFLFGFWLCCFLPFCMDSCQDVTHRCPSCNKSLGQFRRAF
ncbi:lipopolysaccharide-induced tumor necrosis factor-alpha factor homolog [Glandiceps talaboti]